jgi:hypothetical protein
MKKIQIKRFNDNKLKTEYISDKEFKKLDNIFKRLQKYGRENDKKMQDEEWYIDFYGEMIPLSKAKEKLQEHLTNKKNI